MNNTYSIQAKTEYLSKAHCQREAKHILDEGYIHGMTEQELSCEIYFHAWAYRISSILEKRIPLFGRIRQAADPIDLADGGDYPIRKLFYRLFWLFPQKKIDLPERSEVKKN